MTGLLGQLGPELHQPLLRAPQGTPPTMVPNRGGAPATRSFGQATGTGTTAGNLGGANAAPDALEP